jgi:hypothetical protein
MRPLLPALLLCAALPAMAQAPADNQSYTLKTQSNVVLIPTTVQTKHGK